MRTCQTSYREEHDPQDVRLLKPIQHSYTGLKLMCIPVAPILVALTSTCAQTSSVGINMRNEIQSIETKRYF